MTNIIKVLAFLLSQLTWNNIWWEELSIELCQAGNIIWY